MNTRSWTSAVWCGIAAFVALVVTMRSARADWPSDAASPLVVGDIQGLGADQHSAVTSPDGATWVSWVDTVCVGTFRLQRIDVDGSLLEPDGIAVYPDPACGAPSPPLLAPCSDNSVVLCRTGVVGMPVQRIGATGEQLWGDGISFDQGEAVVSGFLPMPNGDVIISWVTGWNILVQRLTPAGQSVWAEPALIETGNTSSRVFGFVTDGAGGALVVWDFSGGPYVRMIKAARVTSEGAVAWGPSVVIPNQPGSSRHTDPVAIADGTGGATIIWTQGSDSPSVQVPLFMTRITHDGMPVFAELGLRISTEVTRQFDPMIAPHASGDIFVTWRDGWLQDTELRAQRMTLAGERLWGDTGVAITPIIGTPQDRFDAQLDGDTFAIVVGDEPQSIDDASVKVHRVDGTGIVAPDPWLISGTETAGAIRIASFDETMIVAWMQDAQGFDDLLVAQRIDANGTIGGPSLLGDFNHDAVIDEADRAVLCSALGTSIGEPGYVRGADLNGDDVIDHLDQQMFNTLLPPCDGDVATSASFAPPPDGVTDGADLAFLLGAWGNQPSCADFVASRTFAPPPDGKVDAADLAYLLGAWGRCR